MRSPFVLLFALMSACALGVDGGTQENPTNDAGAHNDAAGFKSNDASSAPDEGTTFQQPDSGTTTVDSGTTTVDSGNNNNNACSFTGTLATFDFSGQPGNQTSTTATQTATNVTAGAITRSTVTATSGANSMNSSNWATSTSIDKTRYYTFTITPQNGCAVDITSLSIDTKASSTGPANGAVATSADQFGATTAFAPNATATPSLSVSGATGAVEVRVYGYGASGTGGTLRVDTTLTVSGSLH